ncbi:MAG: 2,3-bisphosphoglycerate-independent phosphoglycerate mutase [Parcubacteria group bacterium GW2011_GWA2_44_12]|nr:MAG: 2,3-bisphosphoglycerate-independent phosphoglycerate mutase [Parcubacteria group bacterium GW2011_GWA2_44_12]
MPKQQKLLLIILDGFGIGPTNEHNAIYLAHTPFYDSLIREYPHTDLHASGTFVGAIPGQIGTSEVGHMNIGAGRVVLQDIARINHEIQSGEFFLNPAFFDAIEHVQKHNSSLHLIGLASTGGVHSHLLHLYALLRLARGQNVPHVFIHPFLDGRDTPPKSGRSFIRDIEQELAKTGAEYKIATLMGRFFAMDRNNNAERSRAAFQALVKGEGMKFRSAEQAVQHFYDQVITDEFIEPCVILDREHTHCISDNDAVIFFNFRADRMRQLSSLFLNAPEKNEGSTLKNVHITSMTAYVNEATNASVAYFDAEIKNTLSEVLSQYSLAQYKIAETEKYAHLTYFLNGGKEEPYAREERFMAQSPRVKHFDETPFMASGAISEEAIRKIESVDFPFIAINYCNADMIGHTGNLPAAMKGIAYMDACMERVVRCALRKEYTVIVTADHGNAEVMYDVASNTIQPAHTLNQVPFILAAQNKEGITLSRGGSLGNIAPTILEILGIEKPREMTCESLLAHAR